MQYRILCEICKNENPFVKFTTAAQNRQSTREITVNRSTLVSKKERKEEEKNFKPSNHDDQAYSAAAICQANLIRAEEHRYYTPIYICIHQDHLAQLETFHGVHQPQKLLPVPKVHQPSEPWNWQRRASGYVCKLYRHVSQIEYPMSARL